MPPAGLALHSRLLDPLTHCLITACPPLPPAGLEFIRFALRRLWLGEQSAAYLRGYSVAHTFEEHVSGFSDTTKK